jgi:hypothetical protein
MLTYVDTRGPLRCIRVLRVLDVQPYGNDVQSPIQHIEHTQLQLVKPVEAVVLTALVQKVADLQPYRDSL